MLYAKRFIYFYQKLNKQGKIFADFITEVHTLVKIVLLKFILKNEGKIIYEKNINVAS